MSEEEKKTLTIIYLSNVAYLNIRLSSSLGPSGVNYGTKISSQCRRRHAHMRFEQNFFPVAENATHKLNFLISMFWFWIDAKLRLSCLFYVLWPVMKFSQFLKKTLRLSLREGGRCFEITYKYWRQNNNF